MITPRITLMPHAIRAAMIDIDTLMPMMMPLIFATPLSAVTLIWRQLRYFRYCFATLRR